MVVAFLKYYKIIRYLNIESKAVQFRLLSTSRIYTEDNLPSDISIVDDLNPDKFTLERMYCRPLQSILYKKSQSMKSYTTVYMTRPIELDNS